MPREKRHSKDLQKGKPGRKKGENIIPIDWEKVANLVRAGCDGQQCAATIGCHASTLYERCVQENNAMWTAWMAEKRAAGDANILAAQFHKAIKDRHPSMLIWLGKQRLAQKDNPDEKEVRANATVDAIAALSRLAESVSPELLEAISKLTPEQQIDVIKAASRPAKRKADPESDGE